MDSPLREEFQNPRNPASINERAFITSPINPAAGKICDTSEEATAIMKSFLQAHTGFHQQGIGFKKVLKKGMKNRYYCITSVQKQKDGRYAWILRFTIKGTKLIKKAMGIPLGEVRNTQQCFELLCKKHFPEMY